MEVEVSSVVKRKKTVISLGFRADVDTLQAPNEH